MIVKNRYLSWFVILITMAISAVAQDRPAADVRDAKEGDLIGVLQSDASKGDKAIACKQLAIYGTEQAVPDLAPLLADADLASWARTALEAIPGPAADAALRNALGALEGRLLVGTINSIAVRRDGRAVGALVQKLGDANADVASAAAVALGHIGGEQAARALTKSLADAPPDVRSAAAEGCILSAEQLLARDMTAEAVARVSKISDSLLDFAKPEKRREDLADLTEVVLTFVHLWERPLAEQSIELRFDRGSAPVVTSWKPAYRPAPVSSSRARWTFVMLPRATTRTTAPPAMCFASSWPAPTRTAAACPTPSSITCHCSTSPRIRPRVRFPNRSPSSRVTAACC